MLSIGDPASASLRWNSIAKERFASF